VNLFGGDRVIYLPDAGWTEHLLYDLVYEGASFSDIEHELYVHRDQEVKSFEEGANFNNGYPYLIDSFTDINQEINYPLNELLPAPDDMSNINFDVKKYSSGDELQKLQFTDEVLLHKTTDTGILFYHLAVFEGLLCIHQGEVGGEETLEVKIDQYAPFIYDELLQEIKNNGYRSDVAKSYAIILPKNEGFLELRAVIQVLKQALKWQGLGQWGGFSGGGAGPSKEHFSIIDESLFLKLLQELLLKHRVDCPFEIVRQPGDSVIYKQ
jgi:hypothetical protein